MENGQDQNCSWTIILGFRVRNRSHQTPFESIPTILLFLSTIVCARNGQGWMKAGAVPNTQHMLLLHLRLCDGTSSTYNSHSLGGTGS
jgi:hypothetical protein